MKKGSRVRILADNRIGVVVDQLFFTLGGKKHLRVQVGELKGEKGPVWFDRNLVTEKMSEKITVTFKSENGQKLDINLITDYSKNQSRCSVDGEDNCNLLMKGNAEIAHYGRQFLMFLASPSKEEKKE